MALIIKFKRIRITTNSGILTMPIINWLHTEIGVRHWVSTLTDTWDYVGAPAITLDPIEYTEDECVFFINDRYKVQALRLKMVFG